MKFIFSALIFIAFISACSKTSTLSGTSVNAGIGDIAGGNVSNESDILDSDDPINDNTDTVMRACTQDTDDLC